MINSIIEIIIFQASISISRPASSFIANGVINGDISVEQAVIVTESATMTACS